jgi:hypothetical protein
MMNFNYVISAPSTDPVRIKRIHMGVALGDACDTDQPVPNQLDYGKWSRGSKRQLHFCGESSAKILMVISNDDYDSPAAPACLDTNSDKVLDSNDNCFHPNSDQKDTDSDY